MNQPYFTKGTKLVNKHTEGLDVERFLKDLEKVLVRHGVDKICPSLTEYSNIGFDNDGNFGITNGMIVIDNGLDRLKERFSS